MKQKLIITKTDKILWLVSVILFAISTIMFIANIDSVKSFLPIWYWAIFETVFALSAISFGYVIADIYHNTTNTKIIHSQIKHFKECNRPCEIECADDATFDVVAWCKPQRNYIFNYNGNGYLLNNYGCFQMKENDSWLFNDDETIMSRYYDKLINKALKLGFKDVGDYNVKCFVFSDESLFLADIDNKWFITDRTVLIPINDSVAEHIKDNDSSIKYEFRLALQNLVGRSA